MRSYIIHMRGSNNRQANVRHLLKVLPEARVADAVIGQEFVKTTPVSRGTQFTPHYPFPLSSGEVGCFLSHRNCWQRIIDDGADYALIAEDDFGFDPEIWPEVLDLIHSHASADTYIRIPAKDRERPADKVAERDRAGLFLPRIIGLQTVCQVVGRTAAKRLLQASEILDRPVDAFVQMHWITGQPVHTIYPNGARELTDELGGSTIQKKTRVGNVLTREFKRSYYRAQINLRPQKA